MNKKLFKLQVLAAAISAVFATGAGAQALIDGGSGGAGEVINGNAVTLTGSMDFGAGATLTTGITTVSDGLFNINDGTQSVTVDQTGIFIDAGSAGSVSMGQGAGAGNVSATGNIQAGTLTSDGTMTVGGDINLTASGNVTTGGTTLGDNLLTLTDGTQSITADQTGIFIDAGGAGSVSLGQGSGAGNISATGSVQAGTLISDGTTTSANTLTVQSGGAAITGNSTITGTLAVNNGAATASLDVNTVANQASLLSGNGHGLTVNNTSATLTGGTNSSSLTLTDAQATLAVGTATTTETNAIVVVGTDNGAGGTNTTVTIGGASNTANSLLATGTGGTNTVTATVSNTLNSVTNTLNATTAAGQNVIQSAGTAADANLIDAAAGGNTINAALQNTITGGTGNVITATTGNNAMTASDGQNVLTGQTGNQVIATTGNNTINAVAGSNTISANADNQSNTLSATGLNGVNNITANATTGTNNIEAKTNNMGVATADSINTIGNADTSTNLITGLTNTMTAGTAAGQNVIQSAGTTATANLIDATGLAGGNTLRANTAGGSNTIEATDATGTNTLTAGASNTIQSGTTGSFNTLTVNNQGAGTGASLTATGTTTGVTIGGTGGTNGIQLQGTVGGNTATALLNGQAASFQNSNAGGLAITNTLTTVNGGSGGTAANLTLSATQAQLSSTTSGNASLTVSESAGGGTVNAAVADQGALTGYGLNITNTGTAATTTAQLAGSGYSVGVMDSLTNPGSMSARMTDGNLSIGLATGSGASMRDTRSTATNTADDTFVAVRAAATGTPSVVVGATTNLGVGGSENTVRFQVGTATVGAGTLNGAILSGSNGQSISMNDGTVGGQRYLSMSDTNGVVYVNNTGNAVGFRSNDATAANRSSVNINTLTNDVTLATGATNIAGDHSYISIGGVGGTSTDSGNITAFANGGVARLAASTDGVGGSNVHGLVINTTNSADTLTGIAANTTALNGGVVNGAGNSATLLLSGTNVSLLNNVADTGNSLQGHGLTITSTETLLTGGTNSSSLTLQDAAATLKVGTATTAEVQVLQATNTAGATSVVIGGVNNVSNQLLATGTGGTNTITAASGNTMTANTGDNVITATTGSNTITAAVQNVMQTGTNNVTVNATTAATGVSITGAGTNNGLVLSGSTTGNPAQSSLSMNSGTASLATATSGGLVITDALPATTNGKAVLTGGTATAGTNMTLNNSGATFAQNTTGAPVRVTGVQDGVSTFDAVNVRQLMALERLMSRGIAASTAAATIPQVDPGKSFAVGMGLGSFNGQTAIAMGATYRFSPMGQIRGTFATGLNGDSTPIIGIGAVWSW